jgi:hypothetical protein
VNLLLRFWDYDNGEIKIGGHDLHEYHIEDVRAMIGVVPQQIHLFNATVHDNLLLANPDATDEQIYAACRQAELHDFIQSLPDGYDTLIGENGLLAKGGSASAWRSPRHPSRCADPDHRRSDGEPGCGDRAEDHGISGAVHSRPDCGDHLAPPCRHRIDRSNHCFGKRAHD